jgi:hypothetical protein
LTYILLETNQPTDSVSELGSKKSFRQKFEEKARDTLGKVMARTSNLSWNSVQVPNFSGENYDFW